MCLGGRSCDRDPSCVVTQAYTTMKHARNNTTLWTVLLPRRCYRNAPDFVILQQVEAFLHKNFVFLSSLLRRRRCTRIVGDAIWQEGGLIAFCVLWRCTYVGGFLHYLGPRVVTHEFLSLVSDAVLWETQFSVALLDAESIPFVIGML